MRYGPNKMRFLGLLQPILDGVKLLVKEIYYLRAAQGSLFFLGPLLLIVVFLVVWRCVLPWGSVGTVLMHSTALLFFVILGVSPYAIVFIGWASTSPFF